MKNTRTLDNLEAFAPIIQPKQIGLAKSNIYAELIGHSSRIAKARATNIEGDELPR